MKIMYHAKSTSHTQWTSPAHKWSKLLAWEIHTIQLEVQVAMACHGFPVKSFEISTTTLSKVT
jgi:hypothetical protein